MTAGLSLLKVLCRQGARSTFRQVNPAHFLPEEMPHYNFIATYYRQYGQLPTMEALNENNLALGLNIRDNEAAEYYLQRVADRFILYSTRDVIQPLQQAVLQQNVGQIREIVTSLGGHIRMTEVNGAVLSLGEALDMLVDRYNEARASPGIQGITFGYAWLDQITGGVQPSDVVTLAGRTGMGKSYFLNHMAMAAWLAGASVLYVSMEMQAIQMVTRFVGQYSGINPEGIRRGQLSNWTEETFFTSIEEMRTGAPFTVVDGSFDLTVDTVDALIQEFNPDLVCIDASYLMKTDNLLRYQAKGHELAREMSKGIKRMALARRKGIIHTVQLNRDAAKKTGSDLDVGMIGNTDGIAQDSTTVLMLAPGAAPLETRTRDLVVGKNREGRTGWLRANFLFEPMDFTAITNSDTAQDETGFAGVPV